MKKIFEKYRTLTGEFEYAMNNERLPRTYKTKKQAEKAIDIIDTKVNFPTKIIKSKSGKVFFIVKHTELINYTKENEERFGSNNDFMNYINGN